MRCCELLRGSYTTFATENVCSLVTEVAGCGEEAERNRHNCRISAFVSLPVNEWTCSAKRSAASLEWRKWATVFRHLVSTSVTGVFFGGVLPVKRSFVPLKRETGRERPIKRDGPKSTSKYALHSAGVDTSQP